MILQQKASPKQPNVAEYPSFKFIVVSIHIRLLIPIREQTHTGWFASNPNTSNCKKSTIFNTCTKFFLLHDVRSCVIDQKIAIILPLFHSDIRPITYTILHCWSSSYGSTSSLWLAPESRELRKHSYVKLFHSSICWKLNEKMSGKSRTQPGPAICHNAAWPFDHWQKTSSYWENQDSYTVSLSLQEQSFLG